MIEITEQTQRQPGRPRQFDEGEVLDAAVDLFWRNGYRDTSTRALESALSMSQSSLYNAFGSKLQLLEAALDHYSATAARALVEPLEASAQGLESIDEFLVALGRWLGSASRRGCLMINTMAEDGGATPSINARTRVYRRRVRNALRAALERASRRGEMPPEVVEVRADVLMSVVLGLNISARGGTSPAEHKRMFDAARAQVRAWDGREG